MRFPKVIRHRRARATIYGKTRHYGRYRVAYYAAGQRRMAHFATYGEAIDYAERVVRDLAAGSPAPALTAGEARDALAARECLAALERTTGKPVSLRACAVDYAEAVRKLRGVPLGEAVDRYLGTVAVVKQQDVAKAVEEFIKAEEPRTKAGEGQRPQLSRKHAYTRAIRLRRFAGTFQNTAVCDLGKTHLDAFIGSLADYSPKSRNHYRAEVKRFLTWATRKDYLPPTHRLFEADTMRPEHADGGDVAFYTAKEFRALLEAAEGPARVMIAIGGLAGLRTAELLRLDWSDVWRVPGHIEVTAGKAKTRQRRLVEVCPTLAAWLEPFRALAHGPVHPVSATASHTENLWHRQFLDVCEQAGVRRKENGLRHAFCTYHFALHANENLTAALAGNSPAMIHKHYKGLATKAEAEAWFAVKPAGTAQNVVPMRGAAEEGQE